MWKIKTESLVTWPSNVLSHQESTALQVEAMILWLHGVCSTTRVLVLQANRTLVHCGDCNIFHVVACDIIPTTAYPSREWDSICEKKPSRNSCQGLFEDSYSVLIPNKITLIRAHQVDFLWLDCYRVSSKYRLLLSIDIYWTIICSRISCFVQLVFFHLIIRNSKKKSLTNEQGL